MRIYGIGDTHLSRARPKPMDIFGEHWRNHEERIRDNWNAVARDDDVLLVAGDISWALRLDEARTDLDFLATFRGHKLLLKGNHDYWWGSLARIRAVAPAGIDFLQNDSRVYGDVAIAGTRGWDLTPRPPFLLNQGKERKGETTDEGAGSLPGTAGVSPAQGTTAGVPPAVPGSAAQDLRIYQRELDRLRLSLESLRKQNYKHLIVMMHYPPLHRFDEPTPFSDLIEAAGATLCVYGHLHGRDTLTAAEGEHGGVDYKLVSADAVDFRPWPAWPPTENPRARVTAQREEA